MTKSSLIPLLAIVAVALTVGISPPAGADPATGRTRPPAGQTIQPTELEDLAYTAEFFPGARYDPNVPAPEELLGFAIGDRFPSPEEIAACLKAWDASSPRTQLVEYARSYEGRPLYMMIISTPDNMNRLDDIKAGMARLADPRDLTAEEEDRLLAAQPAVGWFSYCIHGNETSGSDAALAVIHHLTAATDPRVMTMLEDLVVIIDPLMNPDGRSRFHKQTEEHRGNVPNVDDQSLLHRGYWPSGRTNHYLFDLNRDWILGVNPETRGRVREIGAWHPVLMIDGHEMGAQNTYLFSPPRDPINPNYPENRWRWNQVFARDQAATFDRHGWLYYTGEWADDWYAGYSSWVAFRGGVHILYEQARIAEDAVRRPEGTLVTYRESVHHQIASTLSNLQTLADHSGDLLRQFVTERRRAISDRGPYANRTFAVLPTENRARLESFVDLLRLQDIEIHVAEREFTAKQSVDQLGRVTAERAIPAGTLLIPNRQPEAHLIAAMLEFDPRMPDETLRREREELLRSGDSRMYDVTAWNLTMMYGLPALTLKTDLPDAAAPYVAPSRAATTDLPAPGEIMAYCFDGADDRSLAAAARLLERGVQVRAADRPFVFDERHYPRGSVVITGIDNQRFDGDLAEAVRLTAAELHLQVEAIVSGLGDQDLPDIGGKHFKRLEPPSIALLARGGVSSNDYGAIWHTLDRKLGIRHSHLNEDRLTGADLRRYNVLVLPDRYGDELPAHALPAIEDWVTAGGTLIAIGSSASTIAAAKQEFGHVRTLPDVLDDLDRYALQILKEWWISAGALPATEAVWSHTALADIELPLTTSPPGSDQAKSAAKDLKQRDDWLRLFMPQGAFLAARTDPKHWLTFGCPEQLPVLLGSAVGSTAVLMSEADSEAPIRLGLFLPIAGQQTASGKQSPAGQKEEPVKIGFAPLPAGHELRLRMSGLLWPEAVHRLANTAYVTRERIGKGQVVLFAAPPIFRGATPGTGRVLLNAIVYGPGFGASHPVRP